MKNFILIAILGFAGRILNAEDLKQEHPAYGIGRHKIIEYDSNAEIDQQIPQIISELSKDGFTYSAVSNWNELKINRVANSAESPNENIVNFNYRLDFGNSSTAKYLRIVDVYATSNEISFLVASTNAYHFFKVTNQNVVVPNGWFLCNIKGINSENWKLIKYHSGALIFRDQRLDWRHEDGVNSIKLLNLIQIEVEKRGSNQADIINVMETSMESNGIALEGIKIINPMILPEIVLIAMFSPEHAPAIQDVKKRVERYEGGKDFILNLLNQFADQNAANQIRTRILEAYPPE